MTPTRVVVVIGVLLVFALISPLLIHHGDALLAGYLLLVLVTAVEVRRARSEPAAWLGRRWVRRCLVVSMAAVCGVLLAIPEAGNGASLVLLFATLMVLNVALGAATQRIATAPDDDVDERQEALRNRSHRIAYLVFAAVALGIAVADVASSSTRSWLQGAVVSGLIVLAELLFVLPAMVLAFIEPSSVPRDEPRPAASRRTQVAAALLALTIVIPFALSLTVVVAPVLSTQSMQPAAAAASSAGCTELSAMRTVGVGVAAELPLHAVVCWNGTQATDGWGMNRSDCELSAATMVTVTTTQCTRHTDADGTLHFTYRVQVSPVLLPFLHRDVTLQAVIDRSGHVEEFP